MAGNRLLEADSSFYLFVSFCTYDIFPDMEVLIPTTGYRSHVLSKLVFYREILLLHIPCHNVCLLTLQLSLLNTGICKTLVRLLVSVHFDFVTCICASHWAKSIQVLPSHATALYVLFVQPLAFVLPAWIYTCYRLVC